MQITRHIEIGVRQRVFALVLGFFLGFASHAAVGPPPTITVQPLDQTVLKGDNASFQVEAKSVTRLTYQWYTAATTGGGKKSKISGATNSTYTVVKATKDALYSVVVANAAGSVSSSNALLRVQNLFVPPIGSPDTYTVMENGTLRPAAPGVLANDIPLNNVPLTAMLESGTAHGDLVLRADGSFTYTPVPEFHGTDTFTYRPTDGLTNGNITTVTVSVLPQTRADSYSVDMNTVLSVPAASGVLANDSSSATDLTALRVSDASHGSVQLNPDGSFAYTPARDYFGTDSFTYSAYNTAVTSAVTTVSLTIRDTTPLRIVSTAFTPQGFALQITGPQVGDYVILRSINLVDWSPIVTNAVTTGTLLFTDPDAATALLGFYRAKLQ